MHLILHFVRICVHYLTLRMVFCSVRMFLWENRPIGSSHSVSPGCRGVPVRPQGTDLPAARPFDAIYLTPPNIRSGGGRPPPLGVFSAIEELRPRIHEQKKLECFERINSMRETNGSFYSCKSCKRLGASRFQELHESKLPFVSRIEFIRLKLSKFSVHVSGV